jgi:hypothetical protein
MAYTLTSPSGDTVLHPDTLHEAVRDFLEAEVPLESGEQLTEKFFSFLGRSGFDAEALAQAASVRPQGALDH